MRTYGGRFCQGRLERPSFLGSIAGNATTLCLAIAVSGVLLAPSAARADEPRSATEPRVMLESGEVTNVIDAFDDDDPFDINVSLGFDFATKSATILRETNIYEPGLTTGGYTANTLNVANYSESTSRLIPRVDIGVYKDLALYLKLPIILAHSRELSAVDGSTPEAQAVALAGAPTDGQLFSLPFASPTRSGLEYIAVGLDFDILAQHRDRTKPTWLLGFEARFPVSEPMHACTENPNGLKSDRTKLQAKCANPADVDRDNATGDSTIEGNDLGERDPGVSRGTIGLEVHTLMSKRIKYVEPYGGFKALVEFQQQSSDYGLTDLEGSLVNHPPLVGTVLAGIMIIPWEDREKYGRLTFDLRIEAQYHSEGRDYSELFDAIGSSDAATLRNPQWARYTQNPEYNEANCTDNDDMTPCYLPSSVVDQNSQKTYTTGLTDVQAYGSYRLSASATWQPAKFIKLHFGMGIKQDQQHGITADQPCNPQFKDDILKSGPCKSGNEGTGETVFATGIPNPNYRATINNVGRRFFVSDSTTFDLSASATVMF